MWTRITLLLAWLTGYPFLIQAQAPVGNYHYQELLAQASLAHLQKEPAKALPLYEQALKLHPPDALTAYKMAGAYALAQNTAQAHRFLQCALRAGWYESELLALDPYFEHVRQTAAPAWAALLRRARRAEQRYEQRLRKPALRRQINRLVIQDQQLRYQQVQARTDAERQRAWRAIQRADSANLAAVRRLVAEHGWPRLSDVGADGANNLWLLVQHADADILFQKHCLQLLEQHLNAGEARRENYAYLYDRVQCNLNYKQRYGTQPIWGPQGTARGFRAIAEEAGVDERRRQMHLPPLRIYAQSMGLQYQNLTGRAARANDSADVGYCRQLVDSARAAYAARDYAKTDAYYLKASMVLSGLSDQENYEAALLFADIARQTNGQQYKDVALDFLNLLYLRGYLTAARLEREPKFGVLRPEPRWQHTLKLLAANPPPR
jgi:hypothetical protein